jgi:hypothetical protein
MSHRVHSEFHFQNCFGPPATYGTAAKGYTSLTRSTLPANTAALSQIPPGWRQCCHLLFQQIRCRCRNRCTATLTAPSLAPSRAARSLWGSRVRRPRGTLSIARTPSVVPPPPTPHGAGTTPFPATSVPSDARKVYRRSDRPARWAAQGQENSNSLIRSSVVGEIHHKGKLRGCPASFFPLHDGVESPRTKIRQIVEAL